MLNFALQGYGTVILIRSWSETELDRARSNELQRRDRSG